METRPLGKSAIEASVVGFGSWAIGGWMWGGSDESAAVWAIQAALDSGVNLIDTAPVYGFGASETIVGKAIAGRRSKVVLATKCGLVWQTQKGESFFNTAHNGASYKVNRFLGPDSVRAELEQSLRRLRVDCVDLYQTHWQEDKTPVEDTMAALLKLKDDGKIRAIGVSNAPLPKLLAYMAAGGVVSCQEKYNMLERKRESDILPFCKKNGLAFLAYSPLAQGLLSGRITAERRFREGDHRRDSPAFSTAGRRKIAGLIETLMPIAAAHSATLAQLAIAWTVRQPGCTHVLVGTRTPEQAMENAAGGNLRLGTGETAAISKALAKLSAKPKAS